MKIQHSLVLLVLALGASAQLAWRTEAHHHLLPTERGGARLVHADGLLVYWGGFFECFTDDGSCDHIWRNDLYHYDLIEGAWENITATSTSGQLPMSRAFFGANFWEPEEVMVIFGGIHYNVSLTEFIPFGDIWFYSPRLRQWSPITPVNDGPGIRIAPNVAIFEDDMYTFGGLMADFQVANDMWKFNLRTKRWTQLIPNGAAGSPGPRYLASFRLDEVNRELIVMGGNIPIAASGAQDNQTWAYTIDRNSWRRLADIPVGRIHNAAEIWNNKFYTAFGDLEHEGADTGCRTPEASSGQSPTDQVYQLDVARNVWTQLFPLGGPGPLKRVCSTRVLNRMYVIGGYNYVCPNGPTTPGEAIWNPLMYSLRLGL
jgi:N-acetylneuraminic acid mutarotase